MLEHREPTTPNPGVPQYGCIVERAPRTHHCRPGWRLHESGALTPVRCHPGDVWQCGCSKRWTAVDAPSNSATIGQRTHGAVTWHPERKRRWWKR